MKSAQQILQWREPTPEITQKVASYISNNADFPQGFGLQNPYHGESHKQLHKNTGLKAIQWLRQTHSSAVCQAPTAAFTAADACWTRRSYVACAVMTADCLPVFFVDAEATQVAVAHAGWRGLAAGILENTLACFPQHIKRSNIYAAFGPAISQPNYEVGEELTKVFPDYQGAFKPSANKGKYLLSLYEVAQGILEKHGIAPPIIPKWCAFASKQIAPVQQTNQTKQDGQSRQNSSSHSSKTSKISKTMKEDYLFPSHRRNQNSRSSATRNARIANLIWLK